MGQEVTHVALIASTDGYYTSSMTVYTLDFSKIYLKSVTLIVTCVRVFSD